MSSDHEAEIRASVAAHRDLGSGYDDAVAEGLVERIGEEIDRRIDARLGHFGAQSGPVPRPGAPPAPVMTGEAAGAAQEVYRGHPGPAGYPPAGYPWHPQYQSPAAPTQPGFQGHPGPVLPAGYQGYPGAVPPDGYPVPPPGYQLPPPGYQTPPGYQLPPPGYQLPHGYQAPPGGQLPTPASSAGQRSVAFTITALGSMAIGVAATAVVSRAANPGAQAVMVLLIWTAIAIINIVYARRR